MRNAETRRENRTGSRSVELGRSLTRNLNYSLRKSVSTSAHSCAPTGCPRGIRRRRFNRLRGPSVCTLPEQWMIPSARHRSATTCFALKPTKPGVDARKAFRPANFVSFVYIRVCLRNERMAYVEAQTFCVFVVTLFKRDFQRYFLYNTLRHATYKCKIRDDKINDRDRA